MPRLVTTNRSGAMIEQPIGKRLGNSRIETRRAKSTRINGADRVDFEAINRAALKSLPSLLRRWLPAGRQTGAEFVALNPRRVDDDRLGSFRINVRTGRWADFATEDARGRDVVSLFAYLTGVRQVEAARRLAEMLGIGPGGRHAS
jgi:hypothetical protein